MIEYKRIIDGRLKNLGIFIILLTAGLIWRMVDLQIFKYAEYTAEAQGQQRYQKTETAQRGRILVKDSSDASSPYYPLAFDIQEYSLWVVPQQVKDKEKTATALANLSGLAEKDIFAKINNDKLYIPALKKGLSFDDATKIKDGNLAGVFVMPEYSRDYPEGSLAAQVLGFVNDEGNGNYGIEGHYNNELQGKEGNVIGEKDTLGRVISLLDQTDPQNGTDYVLTIDRSVQYFVEQKLAEALPKYGAVSGTIIVEDIKTGGIVAMASTPTFDPNNFKTQAATDQSVFMNPAISSVYEPGSIFKPIVMSAALDSGAVTPETQNTFGASVDVDGFTIHTAEGKAFGTETMSNILEHSDNVGMVWVGQQMGNDNFLKYLNAYDLNQKTGIDLQGETVGTFPAKKDWRNITNATLAFGQGVSVTPIELLTAYATIGNGGKYIYPHLVDKMIYNDGTEKQITKQEGEQVIKPETAAAIEQMLYNVVLYGTSKKAAVDGFKVGVKTGTAQIPDPATGGYLDNDSKLGIYNHSAAGIAPVDNPQFAMLVKLEKPTSSKYAESTAVPLWHDIADFLLNHYYRLTPTP